MLEDKILEYLSTTSNGYTKAAHDIAEICEKEYGELLHDKINNNCIECEKNFKKAFID